MYLEHMNYPGVEEYLSKRDTVMIVTGSTENHGKHMPLGTDTLIPEKIAEMVDQKAGDRILIAPSLHYGATEDLSGFAGTVSIGVDGLMYILERILDRLYDHGFRRFIVLNGHGGNSKAIEQVGMKLWDKGAILARVDWWLLAGELNRAWKGGHGGGEETAGVMAVDPSLIKREYLSLGENIRNDLGEELPSASWTSVSFKGGSVTIPRRVDSITDNGWLTHGMGDDAPTRADEKWGREMLETVAGYVCDFAEAFERVQLPIKKER